jgi:N6-L-threonylcarbamoyladenine synthase
MKILGIETSCDETAAAVVTDAGEILSNIIRTQIDEHAAYGGVVPELASRAHIEFLDGIIARAIAESGCNWSEIDAIAATAGPGLIGGVIVGVMQTKALASALGKPFIAVNHLEGHALTARLTNKIEFPYLLLLVSGGHSQILRVEGVGKYELLGETLDDAVGESFDKLAKMLALAGDISGGAKVEKLAAGGNENAFELPHPLLGRTGCDFSFSGLKTAVKKRVESKEFSDADICAVFQKTIGNIICDRLTNAFSTLNSNNSTLVVAGGVAANKHLRSKLEDLCSAHNMRFVAPPLALCTDNAAMIAWAGIEKLKLGQTDSLDFNPRARWPLAAF